jgi:hypothetical protein
MSFARFPSPRTLTLPRRVSMDIYSSDKAVPYVYICTHKETNQFYIGYRMANVKLNIPSHLDLPEYKTSSTTIRPDFSNYTWTIVAEFFDPSHAYTFEQQLIYDNWENPLLLNDHYNLGKNQFRTSGPISDEHRKKLSDAKKGKPSDRKGKPISDEHRKKISDARKGMKLGPRSTETKQKISDAKKGKTLSTETKQKMSDVRKGRKQKLVECPHCGLVGGISNMKRKHFDNCSKKPI